MDFANVIKQKTTDELLRIHSQYYDYQKEFILLLEQELRNRGVFFEAVDYEEWERKESIRRAQDKELRKMEDKNHLKKGVLEIVVDFLCFLFS